MAQRTYIGSYGVGENKEWQETSKIITAEMFGGGYDNNIMVDSANLQTREEAEEGNEGYTWCSTNPAQYSSISNDEIGTAWWSGNAEIWKWPGTTKAQKINILMQYNGGIGPHEGAA